MFYYVVRLLTSGLKNMLLMVVVAMVNRLEYLLCLTVKAILYAWSRVERNENDTITQDNVQEVNRNYFITMYTATIIFLIVKVVYLKLYLCQIITKFAYFCSSHRKGPLLYDQRVIVFKMWKLAFSEKNSLMSFLTLFCIY